VIRALIADDEGPARLKLRRLLEEAGDFEVLGEAADGAEAVEQLRRAPPDVVFLDIQMPRLDGFQVVAEVGIENLPAVVFVTAYDEHALRAFEVQALDYLLKPFSLQRFQQVLRRVRERLAEPAPRDLARRIGRLLETATASGRHLGYLLAERAPGRELLVPVAAVDMVRAERNTVRLVTREGEYLRRDTLTALAERLDPEKFLRINRSEIVRLAAVRELQPWFHGDYRVILHDGSVLTWSRRYRAQSKDRF
jgi:two-component system LytT family response regulator